METGVVSECARKHELRQPVVCHTLRLGAREGREGGWGRRGVGKVAGAWLSNTFHAGHVWYSSLGPH